MLCGSEEIMDHLQNKLNIKPGQTTDDGLFTLKEVECLGACVGAPMLLLDKQYHEHLTPEKIDQILQGLTP
jgi:NADH-quinone oxidoreductase subunit E